MPPFDFIVNFAPFVPATVTDVACIAVTVRVEVLPSLIETGLAAMVTVGAGFGVTSMVTVSETLPPAPVAVTVYSVVLAGTTAFVPPVFAML